MIHTWTTPEPRAYATPEEAARGLERLLDDLADTRGTCVAALANHTLPGLIIFITSLSICLVGDGLTTALNPKLRKL